jgi:hypothetical protein
LLKKSQTQWVDLVILHSEPPPTFEKYLIEIMIDEKCTMAEALDLAFSDHGVDTDSVFDMVDFLEEQVYDLDKVQAMMMIYTGQITDFQLTRMIDDEKTKRPNKG